MPGLSRAAGNLLLPPPDSGAEGGFNQLVEWSASWNAWDGAPVDTASLWGISLRTTDGQARNGDVTPRRLQTFRVTAGASYAWENRRVSDDGLLVEGFAMDGNRSPYAVDDWRLQLGRVLGFTRAGKALLARTYVDGAQERLFILGSYLLVKGSRTYLDFETSDALNWRPEYDVPIGSVLSLRRPASTPCRAPLPASTPAPSTTARCGSIPHPPGTVARPAR